MLADLALRAGDLGEVTKAAAALPPAEAAAMRAIAAYEAGDLEKLAAEVEAAKGTPRGAAIALARERLEGRAPIDHERAAKASKSGAPWGDVVAADAALDEGDLARAKEIVVGWPDGAKHPLRALRVARLARYEGKLADARAALDAAAKTRPALIERALLDAEDKAARAKAIAALDEQLGPERPWLLAYLRGRHGSFDAARRSVLKLKSPPAEAPRSLRMAAALAFGEMVDKNRGEAIVRPLIEAWPKSPEAIRAAVGLGLLPPDALKPKK